MQKITKMKKFILLATVAFSTAAFAQKMDCTATKAELTNVKAENAELTKQNVYYKETLNLLTPIKTSTTDGLKIDIVSATASRKNKTLSLTAIYTNVTNETRKIAASEKIISVDPRGNQYSSINLMMGANSRWGTEVRSNIPLRATADFRIGDNEFPMIRQLTWFLKTNENIFTEIPINFENIPVNWVD